MGFNHDAKARVIAAAEQVYWSYLALEFANNEGKNPVAEQIELAIKKGQMHPTLRLNNQDVPCTITKDADLYQITLSKSATLPAIQALKKYSDDDKLKVISQHTFTARLNTQTGKYVLGVKLDEAYSSHEIGGPDKISLFKMHIANLGLMIAEYKTNNEPKTILAALATGSGKTFTQGLWMFVLTLANVPGLFAAPGKLVHQLHSDLKRLLPDTICDNIFEVNSIIEEKSHDESTALITSAELKKKIAEAKNPIAVMPFEELLDSNWDLLSQLLDPKASFISFDEQHLVSAREDRAVKLQTAAARFPSMFLTATPSQVSYELCGNKALLTLSKRQKVEQGYAVATENIHVQSKTNGGQIDEAKPYFKSRKEWLGHRMASGLTSLVLGQAHTAVAEFMSQTRLKAVFKKPDFQGLYFDANKVPAMSQLDKARNVLRWNVTLPAADKMLVIASDHDTLINLDSALESSSSSDYVCESRGIDNALRNHSGHVYRKGKMDIGTIAGEDLYLNAHRQIKLKESVESYVKKSVCDVNVDELNILINNVVKPRAMGDFSEMVIISGVINNALRIITGLDFITLDKMRFNDLDGLVSVVNKKISKIHYASDFSNYYDNGRLESDYIKTLIDRFIEQDGLDSESAKVLAIDVAGIIKYLQNPVKSNHYKRQLIDNWVFNAKENMQEVGRFWFLSYVNVHQRKVYNCENIEHNDAKIENYKPYSGFKMKSIPLFLPDKRPNPEARGRKQYGLAAMMAGAGASSNAESITGYDATPAKLTNQEMEKAFKLGLIPYLIGNTKAEGFNDENLQVTVHLVADMHDSCNQPAKIVQASGRPRGLNPTRLPIYMQIDNVGVNSLFSLKSLDKKDYIPDFLKGTNIFHRTIFEKQGTLIAEELNDWIFTNIDSKGEVDGIALKKQVFSQIINAIQETNINNDHKLVESRKQLVKILNSVSKELDCTKYKLQNMFQVSTFVKVIVAAVNFVCRVFGFYRFRKANIALKNAVSRIDKNDKLTEDQKSRSRLYQKIVSQNYKTVVKTQALLMNHMIMIQVESAKLRNYAEINQSSIDIRDCDSFHLYREYLCMPAFTNILKNILNTYSKAELLLIVKQINPIATLETVNDLAAFGARIESNYYKENVVTRELLRDDSMHIMLVNAISGELQKCHDNFRGFGLASMMQFGPDRVKKPEDVPGMIKDLPGLAEICIKQTDSFFQTMQRGIFLVDAYLSAIPEMNTLYAISEKRRLEILDDVNQNLIKPIKSKLSYGCLSSCGLFGRKETGTQIPNAKASVKDFVSQLNKAKPINLDEAVSGKESCMQPLTLQFAR